MINIAQKSFDDIDVSTKTVICKTNWKININELFNVLPITEYTVLPKKRGRRPKDEKKIEPQQLNNGDIITLKFDNKLRGVNLKEKKNSKGFFRNSLTIVMQAGDKLINLKVSRNGKFQFTGCKLESSSQSCIEYIKQYVTNSGNNKILQVICNANPDVVFLSVMTNINFSLGFNINRENLDKYINTNTDYRSLLETSFGYTGVNIKIPLETIGNSPVRHITFKNNKWDREDITYEEYLATLDEKVKVKEYNKIRYNTFLVFQSGNCISSAMTKECMRVAYHKFLEIISECRDKIEENIEVPKLLEKKIKR